MKVSFFVNYLNHHQVEIADSLYMLLGDDFKFVATRIADPDLMKGGRDYSNRPYCVRAFESVTQMKIAKNLALISDCCIFGGESKEFAILRARKKPEALSFEMGERWLKRGWLNVLSPHFIKWRCLYSLYFRKANFYYLCSSAFGASDLHKVGSYKGRCFKWGYFTKVNVVGIENRVEMAMDVSTPEITPLMWCSRFLVWKHPELPILMAKRLKEKGYRFELDMYGSGEYEGVSKDLVEKFGVSDVVKFKGNLPNEQILKEMRKHLIFLFTSDQHEGWGAVANESMASGCVLVGSDAIGSIPYLVTDGVNGLSFKSPMKSHGFKRNSLKVDEQSLDSLCDKVEYLLTHPEVCNRMSVEARRTMRDFWSPANAASSLVKLIDNLMQGKSSGIVSGPCSLA